MHLDFNQIKMLSKLFGKRRGYVVTAVMIFIGMATGSYIVFYAQDILHPGIALLWAMAYLVVGGLGGMIFGIPKTVPSNSVASKGGDDLSGLANTQPDAKQRISLQENTNLFQVSDWLTKIIVGAGLVQMRDIPGFVIRVAEKMSEGLIEKSATMPAAVSASSAIIIYFVVLGFISGYLVTKVMVADMLEGPGS